MPRGRPAATVSEAEPNDAILAFFRADHGRVAVVLKDGGDSNFVERAVSAARFIARETCAKFINSYRSAKDSSVRGKAGCVAVAYGDELSERLLRAAVRAATKQGAGLRLLVVVPHTSTILQWLLLEAGCEAFREPAASLPSSRPAATGTFSLRDALLLAAVYAITAYQDHARPALRGARQEDVRKRAAATAKGCRVAGGVRAAGRGPAGAAAPRAGRPRRGIPGRN